MILIRFIYRKKFFFHLDTHKRYKFCLKKLFYERKVKSKIVFIYLMQFAQLYIKEKQKANKLFANNEKKTNIREAKK